MEHNLGSSLPNAIKQSQMVMVGNVNKQAYIQGIDDDFFIATLITIIGVIPVLFLVVKKKEKLKLKPSER
jgi:DHA2 family multidrug resistance protein